MLPDEDAGREGHGGRVEESREKEKKQRHFFGAKRLHSHFGAVRWHVCACCSIEIKPLAIYHYLPAWYIKPALFPCPCRAVTSVAAAYRRIPFMSAQH